jgi:2,4-diaminopentanoate dehydrogenase
VTIDGVDPDSDADPRVKVSVEETRGNVLRVIQWATGTVGKHAVAAITEDESLELVGVRVYDADKAGRDAGEICGVAPTGVLATTNVDDLIALDADCVLYAAQGEMDPTGTVDEICALLASGKNVISTALTGLIYPASLGGDVAERLEAACQRGRSSFHGTGIEPGWASEVLPLVTSGLLRRIDSIRVQELMDYSTYPSADMLFDIMGFGCPPESDVPLADASLASGPFRAPIMLVALGLGTTIEDFVYERRVAVADRDLNISAGQVKKGTVSAQWFGLTGTIDGLPAITVEHITRVGSDQAPEWPTGRGWRVVIEGAPSIKVEATIGINDEDEADQGCLGTAMHAIHAIRHVCAARPGIQTFLDLPMITGRGTMRSPRPTL